MLSLLVTFDKNSHYELLIKHKDISDTSPQLCSELGMETFEGITHTAL